MVQECNIRNRFLPLRIFSFFDFVLLSRSLMLRSNRVIKIAFDVSLGILFDFLIRAVDSKSLKIVTRVIYSETNTTFFRTVNATLLSIMNEHARTFFSITIRHFLDRMEIKFFFCRAHVRRAANIDTRLEQRENVLSMFIQNALAT